MSWLSLCLDSADRQISGGNACDGIRESAAIAPICQSWGMRACRPTVLQIMSVLASSPRLLFIPISSPCSSQWAVLYVQREEKYFPLTGTLLSLLENTSTFELASSCHALCLPIVNESGSFALYFFVTKVSGNCMYVWLEPQIHPSLPLSLCCYTAQ